MKHINIKLCLFMAFLIIGITSCFDPCESSQSSYMPSIGNESDMEITLTGSDSVVKVEIHANGYWSGGTLYYWPEGTERSNNGEKMSSSDKAKTPTFTFTNLQPNTTYNFQYVLFDGKGSELWSQVHQYTTKNAQSEEKTDSHEYVDLGLPSGTLWATMNVGATSPEGYGDYFAWGETRPQSSNSYDYGSYKYFNCSNDTIVTKYCTSSSIGTVDNKTELELADDAAYVNWGSDWCMPTDAQQQELVNSDYTTTTWTDQNGVKGRKITSKTNGKSIFLPAAGYRHYGSLYNAGSGGGYWSRSLYSSYSDRAYGLYFGVGYVVWDYYNRCCGRSIRPVRAGAVTDQKLVTSIELSSKELQLIKGDEATLTASIMPSDATNKNVTWTTSNSTVATVSGGKVTALSAGTAIITCTAQDGSGVKATCLVTVKAAQTAADANGHEYVDLGLPSGTLWATMNVGATAPEGYGNYYAWGETSPQSSNSYDWSSYKWCNGSSTTLTKYCTNSEYGTVDNKAKLELADDAAHVNWGGDWRMPTHAQQSELVNSNYTTTTWTDQNGVKGLKITSKTNGKSIFLPAAGSRYGGSLKSVGTYGDYLSSKIDPYDSSYNAWILYFSSSSVSAYGYSGRCYGRSVRPVLGSVSE